MAQPRWSHLNCHRQDYLRLTLPPATGKIIMFPAISATIATPLFGLCPDGAEYALKGTQPNCSKCNFCSAASNYEPLAVHHLHNLKWPRLDRKRDKNSLNIRLAILSNSKPKEVSLSAEINCIKINMDNWQ